MVCNGLLDLLKLGAGMRQINLVKLSIIGLSAINTSTGSCPRSTSRSVSFVGLALIFIGYLIKINVTFGINGLCGRIIHLTVNDHLIQPVVLLVLLVGNKAGAKRSTDSPTRNTIRSSRQRVLIIRINANFHQNGLNRIRIRTSILRQVGLSSISITIMYCLCRRIKRYNLIAITASKSGHINCKISRRTGLHINLKSRLTIDGSKHTILRNNIVAGNQKLIIGALEPNAAEPKRKRHLHRHSKFTTLLLSHGGNRNAHIQRRIPRKFRTLSLKRIFLGSVVAQNIYKKIGGNILYALLHGGRVNVHIIVP